MLTCKLTTENIGGVAGRARSTLHLEAGQHARVVVIRGAFDVAVGLETHHSLVVRRIASRRGDDKVTGPRVRAEAGHDADGEKPEHASPQEAHPCVVREEEAWRTAAKECRRRHSSHSCTLHTQTPVARGGGEGGVVTAPLSFLSFFKDDGKNNHVRILNPWVPPSKGWFRKKANHPFGHLRIIS